MAQIVTFADGEHITNIVDNYEGIPFLGPNSLCHRSDGAIFFTDSGPLGVTTLAKPNGSLFAITGLALFPNRCFSQMMSRMRSHSRPYPKGLPGASCRRLHIA
ncbi:hypothetical protein BVRB_038680 [Beta vulgaris subsp. vulgaris]|uniref:Uncharacterized protein n=1 Tax=Beta vulgaris subsp. vulgaris TaxID=3555 RepID=A0A0J7YNM3_BETVV|nr:hypothetical protein BVRB_038680 [Beta vulgaris subsp. vulgaris]